ncbi:MAG: hypothetical protein R3B12_04845 [Candidatus Saccharimonadales bacterium]
MTVTLRRKIGTAANEAEEQLAKPRKKLQQSRVKQKKKLLVKQKTHAKLISNYAKS